MSNIKIERSKIEKIIENYILKSQVVSIDELTDKIWEYIEETIEKVKYPVTVRIKEGTSCSGNKDG